MSTGLSRASRRKLNNPTDTTRARLEVMAEYYAVTLEATESVLRRWRDRKRS